MAESKVPYVAAYGRIKTVLEKIHSASTPERFTQDYLSTTLDMKGGSATALIPFLKRVGLLGSDGVPTELYNQYRGSSRSSGTAIAKAMKIGYAPLYEINEFVHDANDAELKGIVVQATGSDKNSSTVRSIVGSFKALKEFADFEAQGSDDENGVPSEDSSATESVSGGPVTSLNLGYTINLHLPATSDITVFNAIFRSLREQLLKG